MFSYFFGEEASAASFERFSAVISKPCACCNSMELATLKQAQLDSADPHWVYSVKVPQVCPRCDQPRDWQHIFECGFLIFALLFWMRESGVVTQEQSRQLGLLVAALFYYLFIRRKRQYTTVDVPVNIKTVGTVERAIHAASVAAKGAEFRAHGTFIHHLSLNECDEVLKQSLCAWAPTAMMNFMSSIYGCNRYLSAPKQNAQPEKSGKDRSSPKKDEKGDPPSDLKTSKECYDGKLVEKPSDLPEGEQLIRGCTYSDGKYWDASGFEMTHEEYQHITEMDRRLKDKEDEEASMEKQESASSTQKSSGRKNGRPGSSKDDLPPLEPITPKTQCSEAPSFATLSGEPVHVSRSNGMRNAAQKMIECHMTPDYINNWKRNNPYNFMVNGQPDKKLVRQAFASYLRDRIPAVEHGYDEEFVKKISTQGDVLKFDLDRLGKTMRANMFTHLEYQLWQFLEAFIGSRSLQERFSTKKFSSFSKEIFTPMLNDLSEYSQLKYWIVSLVVESWCGNLISESMIGDEFKVAMLFDQVLISSDTLIEDIAASFDGAQLYGTYSPLDLKKVNCRGKICAFVHNGRKLVKAPPGL